jgi:hypothetical protein
MEENRESKELFLKNNNGNARHCNKRRECEELERTNRKEKVVESH